MTRLRLFLYCIPLLACSPRAPHLLLKPELKEKNKVALTFDTVFRVLSTHRPDSNSYYKGAYDGYEVTHEVPFNVMNLEYMWVKDIYSFNLGAVNFFPHLSVNLYPLDFLSLSGYAQYYWPRVRFYPGVSIKVGLPTLNVQYSICNSLNIRMFDDLSYGTYQAKSFQSLLHQFSIGSNLLYFNDIQLNLYYDYYDRQNLSRYGLNVLWYI